ncbi:MAG TPA: branched-chain amino acid ABC transporter permease [Ktedonobacterales bacterium]|nr:branched-chain amino acid ABC transporter permease [Ktedonobacterales bacterium]
MSEVTREATSDAPSGDAPTSQWRRFLTSRRRALLLIGVAVWVLVFLLGGDNWLLILNVTMIAAIATLSLNVLSGYTGLISLGITFFMGIGAYTAAWLGGPPPTFPGDPMGHSLSIFIWLPAAGIVAALVGALVGPTALRLKGFYLAIVTLALVFIGLYLFKNARTITGGPQGRIFPGPSFGDFSFASPTPVFGVLLTTNQWYFVFLTPLLALVALFVYNVMRSRAGRAFQAVRDNETGAAIIGVNLFQAKMGAFILSSFLAGIAGALWAAYPGGYAEPNTWDLILAIQFVAALLVGGVASVWGSILGAAFVFGLPLALDTFSIIPQNTSATAFTSGDLSAILYGGLIILFMLFEPAGIIGFIRRFQVWARRFENPTDGRGKGGEVVAASEQSEFES